MSWTDSFTRSPTRSTRPTRSTYLPPHLRNPTIHTPFLENPRNFGGFPTESNNHHRVTPSRGGFRGRGGGRRGGRSWAPPSRSFYSDPEPNPFEVFEKFDELEVVEETEANGGGLNFDAYEDIPVECTGSDIPAPAGTFADIDLGDSVNENVKRCRYVKPTPVQRHAIPVALAGRDLMACAQTGSGKTAAFCFPIISGILRHNLSVGPAGFVGQMMRTGAAATPAALILSPTRELSCQVVIYFVFLCSFYIFYVYLLIIFIAFFIFCCW